MNLQRISGDAGLIGPNCVVAFPGGHFCVGQGDVYVPEGGPPRSVIDVRMRGMAVQHDRRGPALAHVGRSESDRR